MNTQNNFKDQLNSFSNSRGNTQIFSSANRFLRENDSKIMNSGFISNSSFKSGKDIKTSLDIINFKMGCDLVQCKIEELDRLRRLLDFSTPSKKDLKNFNSFTPNELKYSKASLNLQFLDMKSQEINYRTYANIERNGEYSARGKYESKLRYDDFNSDRMKIEMNLKSCGLGDSKYTNLNDFKGGKESRSNRYETENSDEKNTSPMKVKEINNNSQLSNSEIDIEHVTDLIAGIDCSGELNSDINGIGEVDSKNKKLKSNLKNSNKNKKEGVKKNEEKDKDFQLSTIDEKGLNKDGTLDKINENFEYRNSNDGDDILKSKESVNDNHEYKRNLNENFSSIENANENRIKKGKKHIIKKSNVIEPTPNKIVNIIESKWDSYDPSKFKSKIKKNHQNDNVVGTDEEIDNTEINLDQISKNKNNEKNLNLINYLDSGNIIDKKTNERNRIQNARTQKSLNNDFNRLISHRHSNSFSIIDPKAYLKANNSSFQYFNIKNFDSIINTANSNEFNTDRAHDKINLNVNATKRNSLKDNSESPMRTLIKLVDSNSFSASQSGELIVPCNFETLLSEKRADGGNLNLDNQEDLSHNMKSFISPDKKIKIDLSSLKNNESSNNKENLFCDDEQNVYNTIDSNRNNTQRESSTKNMLINVNSESELLINRPKKRVKFNYDYRVINYHDDKNVINFLGDEKPKLNRSINRFQSSSLLNSQQKSKKNIKSILIKKDESINASKNQKSEKRLGRLNRKIFTENPCYYKGNSKSKEKVIRKPHNHELCKKFTSNLQLFFTSDENRKEFEDLIKSPSVEEKSFIRSNKVISSISLEKIRPLLRKIQARDDGDGLKFNDLKNEEKELILKNLIHKLNFEASNIVEQEAGNSQVQDNCESLFDSVIKSGKE